MDGTGLKLEKIGQFFRVWMLRIPKSSKNVLWLALSDTGNSFDIFVVALQKHFVYD